ncbi:acyl-CoA dehydrogenase family protein [Rhodopila sp.]|uniref:acyl-CoA dehydrogenase family protein n=1 Tax=Rhodopila sp. TaxID=2480087 RepID=UPI003D0A1E58
MSSTAELLFSRKTDETPGVAPPPALSPSRAVGHIAPDCAGMNFYDIDNSLHASLRLNMDAATYRHFEPYFSQLGGVAGGRLDTLARIVDRNPPMLEHRDRFGQDLDAIIYHPAYREMEKIGFEDFKLHAMCHAAGHFGLDRPSPQASKYVFQYLFSQSEFGMMCPLSITDATIHVLRASASEELKSYLLPKMLSTDLSTLWKGTQFMTERAGGSDVGSLETTARLEQGVWRLYGDKWFASHTDAHVALILARPEGARGGTGGIALFALPRYLPDGSRNKYRIVRIKDKMGTKSLATCEIVLEGAEAYLVGDAGQGLKQMMEQVNMSRLSHGVRAAGMMRRCLHESLQVARNRDAFGDRLIRHPLLRRQVMKILVPAEQALSLSMLAAGYMDRARAGSNEASQVIRILTPLVKFRACRDAISATRAAMETRGGNGYIEEWVNAKLVRDSHIGVLWEGTSNINAIDVVRRAVSKAKAHDILYAVLNGKLGESDLPDAFRRRLATALDKSFRFIVQVAGDPAREHMARQAASGLYNAASAVVLAWEGAHDRGDARKLLVSRLVLEHRVEAADPLAPADGDWEREAYAMLLDRDRCPSLGEVNLLLVAG